MSARFHLDMDVRWGDMDALGHVNNTEFLRYLEECRLAWFLTLPGDWINDERGPVVANIKINFRRPIHHPARLRVSLEAEAASGKRLLCRHRILDADEADTVYADAEITVVWVDLKTGRAISLPDEVRSVL